MQGREDGRVPAVERKEIPEMREDSGGLARGQLVPAVTGTDGESQREMEVFSNKENRASEPLFI